MSGSFYKRLCHYFTHTAEQMRAQAAKSGVLQNRSDSGSCREENFSQFLCDHLPSTCTASLGGFLFGLDGSESKQIDIIISGPDQPMYKVGVGGKDVKTFTCVDGTIAVASVKSHLDKKQIYDSLECMAAIPLSQPIERHRPSPLHKFPRFDSLPFKMVYAHDGIAGQSAVEHINQFYRDNPTIPIARRVDFVHVLGKYAISYVSGEGATTNHGVAVPPLTYFLCFSDEGGIDAWAFTYAIGSISGAASATKLIVYVYDDIYLKVAEYLTSMSADQATPSPSPPPPQTPSTSPS